MTQTEVLAMARDLVITTALLTAPTILVSILVGTVISMLQTITSIQEQTLSFAPRMAAVYVVALLTLPWSLNQLLSFTHRMLEHAAQLGR
jgi:flagellar biosynthetic protein FliQ